MDNAKIHKGDDVLELADRFGEHFSPVYGLYVAE